MPPHGGQGEILVPPHAGGSVNLSWRPHLVITEGGLALALAAAAVERGGGDALRVQQLLHVAAQAEIESNIEAQLKAVYDI